MKYSVLFLVGTVLSIYACTKDKVPIIAEVSKYEQGEELSAGNTTIYDETSFAFSYPVKGLTQEEKLAFFVGNSFFQDNWVEAPSSTTARDGLGPLFNTKSCASCHFKDGRGQPASELGMIFRLSVPGQGSNNESILEAIYGGQFQDNNISTVNREGNFNISYIEIPGTFPDGTTYTLRKPTYSFNNLNYGAMEADFLFSPRIAQQMIGLGLLELINESDVLARADEFDSDADGISGKVNYVWNPISQLVELGRFGWKANVSSVELQVAAALNGDIGITTSYFPFQNNTVNQPSCAGLPDGGNPEISNEDLAKLVLYSRTLGVPIRRNYMDPDVLEGKQLFNDIGCVKCHNPKSITGNGGNINALKNVTIRPYTDLLLHDLGEDMADNRPDFLASGREWRTQPLWGLGLIPTVNGHTFLLHDGRARSIQEAILWHAGEALPMKNKFKSLTKKERDQLLKFLESL